MIGNSTRKMVKKPLFRPLVTMKPYNDSPQKLLWFDDLGKNQVSEKYETGVDFFRLI